MIIFILLGLASTTLFYYFFIKPLDYWRKRGVKQNNPTWFFGDNFKLVMRSDGLFDHDKRLYDRFPNARYCGAYQFTAPVLVIRDPELIKQITVKDFDHFMNRKPFVPAEAEPLWSKNLVLLQGQKWKDMRNLMSPAYTSSKMKFLFNLICESSENFVSFLANKNDKLVEVETLDIFGRFTNDVIASTAYGIKVDSLTNPENEFLQTGKEAVSFSGLAFINILGYQLFPKLYESLNLGIIPTKATQFFIKVVMETVEAREKKGITRPDMLHLLIEQRNKVNKFDRKDFTDKDIAAQAFIFFIGGFDTISGLLCTLTYELAVNPDVQARLRNEIIATKGQCGGTPTFEAIMGMKYMDMVVSECLRKWPVMVNIQRVCTKPYTIQPILDDEIPVEIEIGTELLIPIFAIHRDPKYWPEPEKFDPERFNEENRDGIDSNAYLPFGEGPRICLGMRFALMEAKTLIFYLLQAFEIIPVNKTKIPLQLDKVSFNLKPEGKMILGFKRIS